MNNVEIATTKSFSNASALDSFSVLVTTQRICEGCYCSIFAPANIFSYSATLDSYPICIMILISMKIEFTMWCMLLDIFRDDSFQHLRGDGTWKIIKPLSKLSQLPKSFSSVSHHSPPHHQTNVSGNLARFVIETHIVFNVTTATMKQLWGLVFELALWWNIELKIKMSTWLNKFIDLYLFYSIPSFLNIK